MQKKKKSRNLLITYIYSKDDIAIAHALCPFNASR